MCEAKLQRIYDLIDHAEREIHECRQILKGEKIDDVIKEKKE